MIGNVMSHATHARGTARGMISVDSHIDHSVSGSASLRATRRALLFHAQGFDIKHWQVSVRETITKSG
jgi:hypothetical protein